MTSQTAKPLDFKDYQKLAKWLTAKMMAKAKTRGLRVDPDDLHQEVCLIWLSCTRNFQPEHGKFSTYFARSALLAFAQGHLVRHVIGKQPEGGMASLNQMALDGEGEELVDLLADEGIEDPEERMMRIDRVNQELEANPVLHRLVQIATAAPPEFMAQLQALKAQQEYARQLGLPARETLPVSLTPDIVRQIFRFNWRQRKLAIGEGLVLA